MSDAETMTSIQGGESSTDYVRFIILSGARTGSNMLASSLNSSPEIVCFRELFNFTEKRFIDFNVEGYDRFSSEDRALRDRDFKAFLHERIFCPHAEEVRAVGFKMPYDHFWGYEGLLQWLRDDEHLRVIHLERRNYLRMLVSVSIARQTGAWVADQKTTTAPSLPPANAWRAIRRRLPGFAGARGLSSAAPAPVASRGTTLTLSQEECRLFFHKTAWDSSYFGDYFGQHPTHSVLYEDITGEWEATLASLQEFLGVEPQPLEARTRRQNPQPLRELIANYDEMRETFRDTEYAWMFED